MNRYAICFILLTLPLPAQACLNDRYTQWAEKEFRSRYGESPGATASDAPMPNPAYHWHWEGFALSVAGLAMAYAAFRITRRKAAERVK
jgi:hypothetical protein